MFFTPFLLLFIPQLCASSNSFVTVQAPWSVCRHAVDELVEYLGQSSSKQALVDFLTFGQYDPNLDIKSLLEANELVLHKHNVNTRLAKTAVTMGTMAARLESLRQYHKVCPFDPCLLNSEGKQFSSLEEFVSSGPFKEVWPARSLDENPLLILLGTVSNKKTKALLGKVVASNIPMAFQPIVRACKDSNISLNGFGLSAEFRNGDYEKTDANIGVNEHKTFMNRPELRHLPYDGNNAARVSSNIGLKLAKAMNFEASTFSTLHSILLNLPLARPALSQLEVDEDMYDRLKSLNAQFPSEFALVSINNIAAQAEYIDVFSILRLLMILERHSDKQVSASAIMKSWNNRRHIRFNVPLNDNIAWLNDVERDDRYKNWIQDLFIAARMQRTKPFKSIKRNMVTCLVFLDVERPDYPVVLKNLQIMVQTMIPIRFGIVPLLRSDSEIASFYETFESMRSVEAAIKSLSNPSLGSKPSHSKVSSYKSLMKQFDLAGLKGGHVALANGRPLTINTNDMIEFKQSLFQMYSGEIDWLFSQIETKHLSNSHNDIYKYVMKNSKGVLDSADQVFAPFHETGVKAYPQLQDDRVIIKNFMQKTLQSIKGYKQIDCTSGKNEDICSLFGRETNYIYSKGRLIAIPKDTTTAQLKLMERYDDIQTSHLPTTFIAKARAAQSKLMSEIITDLHGLFTSLTVSPHSKYNMEGIKYGSDDAQLHISIIINPISTLAQRIVALAHNLQPWIKINIILNPHVTKTEFPMNSFYRFVDGKPLDLSLIPKDINLAVSVDAPNSWLLRQTYSNVDIDNMSLNEQPVAKYELKNLIIEGRALNALLGAPASGHQMKLNQHRQVADYPVVMDNNGYYQGKATPGRLSLSTRDPEVAVMQPVFVNLDRLDSLCLPVLSVAFKMNEKERQKRLLEYKPDKYQHGDINIFTIASGHVYEHLAQIMITSVTNNTDKRVKLWLVEAVSSAKLRQNMKTLSEKLGFDLQFVDYKWPPWMFKKPIKTRSIKQYKMLFLDTMFPSDLERLIFVDADQVARADLHELYSTDLQEKVYAFTPFCESRKENEGFMFWKNGYWKSHLDGRPYHITAMFLVDMNRLRAFRTADLLRRQYQMFANDPNSLMNEDQDLPNAIQQMAPIHSLPSQWLWCESWCADGVEKEQAKIIDLCNNPAKKENKLVSAKRIIPEWSKYDKQVKILLSSPANEKEDL